MNYSYYVGIDVSKEKLDLAVLDKGVVVYETIMRNNPTALRKFMKMFFKKWAKQEMLFCLEPTGHYSYVPVRELYQAGAAVWVATPADIRQSIGMQRGKNDAVDARRIAEYAYRFNDKARLIQSKELQLLKLKQLITYREELVADRAKFKVQITDYKNRFDKEVYNTIREANTKLVKLLNNTIAAVEQQIEQMIAENKETKERYELIQTITGVGKVLARTIIATTSDFSRFTSARALACHSGVAPFQYTSGSSIRSKNRVSHRANKRLKSLLHMAALSSVKMKGELRDYYLRKVQEGKPKMLVLNAVRNKIVARILAVMKRHTPYKINLQIP